MSALARAADDPRGAAARPRGRVFDVQRFSVHDGPGIRTTVFLAGCPLRCAWCHNPESFTGAGARWLGVDETLAEVLADRDYHAVSGGGLTVSGGEPLLSAPFVAALLSAARAEGLHTCVQTSGAVDAEAIRAVLPHTDLFQVDLKHMDPARHRALTGEDTTRIAASVELLLAHAREVELRMPVVPGLNDDPENLEAVAAFLAAHHVGALRLLPYQRWYLDKYARLGLSARCAAVRPPDEAALAALVARFGRVGITATVEV